MNAMFSLEFGDLEETTAGNPSTEAPVAKRERCRKRRREDGPGTNGEEEAGVMEGKRRESGGCCIFCPNIRTPETAMFH
jgi:hypothetical protein